SGAALVLLAAVLPSFFGHHRCCTNDSAAIGALKTIANAQWLFSEGDKDGDGSPNFAPTLRALANTGPGKNEDLVDEVLAGGTRSGYVFAITSVSQGGWTANAAPARPGVTGDRYFGINSAGQLFFSLTGPVRFNPDGSSPDAQLG